MPRIFSDYTYVSSGYAPTCQLTICVQSAGCTVNILKPRSLLKQIIIISYPILGIKEAIPFRELFRISLSVVVSFIIDFISHLRTPMAAHEGFRHLVLAILVFAFEASLFSGVVSIYVRPPPRQTLFFHHKDEDSASPQQVINPSLWSFRLHQFILWLIRQHWFSPTTPPPPGLFLEPILIWIQLFNRFRNIRD